MRTVNPAKVCVVVRVRPPCEDFTTDNGNVFNFVGTRSCLVANHEFMFDRVFAPDISQATLFYTHFNENVNHVIDGYNSTIISYGQTAAGKSFTMLGGDSEDECGIIPRALRMLLENVEGTIQMSYLELYNESLRDLFGGGSTLHMLGDGTPVGAERVTVHSEHEALKAVYQATKSRVTASTNMNLTSSRSHSLLILQVPSGAQLVLVDLAGSETVRKTGAKGQRLREAGSINRSLTGLAAVIDALTKKSSKAQHIPFRDSKLTQLLQRSLGGDSMTTLIINCSPSVLHLQETLRSLRFGARAKLVELNVPSSESRERTALLAYWTVTLEDSCRKWRINGPQPVDQWPSLSQLQRSFPDFLDIPAVPTHSLKCGTKIDTPSENDVELHHLSTEMAKLTEELHTLDRHIESLLLWLVTKRRHMGGSDELSVDSDEYRYYESAVVSQTRENTMLRQILHKIKSTTPTKKRQEYLKRINLEAEHYFSILQDQSRRSTGGTSQQLAEVERASVKKRKQSMD